MRNARSGPRLILISESGAHASGQEVRGAAGGWGSALACAPSMEREEFCSFLSNPISTSAGGMASAASLGGLRLGMDFRNRSGGEDVRRLAPLGGGDGFHGRGRKIGKHTSELQSRENLGCRLLLET